MALTLPRCCSISDDVDGLVLDDDDVENDDIFVVD